MRTFSRTKPLSEIVQKYLLPETIPERRCPLILAGVYGPLRHALEALSPPRYGVEKVFVVIFSLKMSEALYSHKQPLGLLFSRGSEWFGQPLEFLEMRAAIVPPRPGPEFSPLGLFGEKPSGGSKTVHACSSGWLANYRRLCQNVSTRNNKRRQLIKYKDRPPKINNFDSLVSAIWSGYFYTLLWDT